MDTFNPQVFRAVLAARHLTMQNVSGRIGLAESSLRDAIETGPSQNVINRLSTELAVPSFVFFMDHAPELRDGIVDFRSERSGRRENSRQTIESIDMARRLQEVFDDIGYVDDLRSDLTLETLSSAASVVRTQLGISQSDQTGASSASAFYALCRKAIESTGVFVMHESFPSEDGSGFCLADSYARLIIINTRNQTPGRRTFTLMHELAHALLRKTGVSDPFIIKNRTEKVCNEFAARLLIPKSLAEDACARFALSAEPSLRDIYKIAKYLNVSQEAIVVRFQNLKLVAPDTHEKWREAVRGRNPDWFTTSGGSGGIPQERIKLAKYGFTFARVVGDALRRGTLSPIDIFRMSGLKPKYQKPYFEFAASAEASDAEE